MDKCCCPLGDGEDFLGQSRYICSGRGKALKGDIIIIPLRLERKVSHLMEILEN